MSLFRDYEGRVEFRFGFITKRRQQIFRLYMKGMSLQRIAQKYGTTVYKIKTTVKKVVDKVCQHYYNLHIYRALVKNGGLTKSEKVILRMWKIQGKNNRQIARAWHISLSGVEWHKWNIRKKVDVGKIDRASNDYNVFDDSTDYTPVDIGLYLLKKQTKAKNKDS